MEQTQIRMPEKLKRILKEVAEEKGISLNAQMLSILWQWAENKEKRESV